MYTIINIQTQHTLYHHSQYNQTLHIWNHIPKRKYSTLLLIDDTTGEILKIKHPKCEF